MKRKAAHLSLLLGLVSLSLVGTTCGVNAAGETSTNAPSFMVSDKTPELEAADQRVAQTEAQLQVAKKQLNAAKTLLRAAEADLKAAKAERDALALKQEAQGMADEAGMGPAKAATVAPVSAPAKQVAVKVKETKPAVTPVQTVTTTPVVTTAPTAESGDAPSLKPTQSVDFNAQPLMEDETAPVPQVQLR